jgi:hypothetical protein
MKSADEMRGLKPKLLQLKIIFLGGGGGQSFFIFLKKACFKTLLFFEKKEG